MATKADLRRMILSHLTVIDETENPSPEQASLLDIFIEAARGELGERGLIWWDDESIPASVLIPFRAYVASQCCGEFGRAGKGFEEKKEPSENRLAALKSSAVIEEQRAEYF